MAKVLASINNPLNILPQLHKGLDLVLFLSLFRFLIPVNLQEV